MEKKMVCIACPMGCQLSVVKEEERPDGYRVEGNKCKRGAAYGIKEMNAPSRTLTTTVKIKNAALCRIPVVTRGEIPKEKLFEAMEKIAAVELTAPVKLGDTVIRNLVDTGIDLVAARTLACKQLDC